MAAFREALFEIVEREQPCSVRQVYYRGIGVLFDKHAQGKRTNYDRVSRNVTAMRERGELPWGWIVDYVRSVRIPTMYESIEDAIERTAEMYQRDLWSRQPRRVEVWCEVEGLIGVLDTVTRPLGIGLYPCKGQAGATFVHESAAVYRRIGKPVSILYVGDFDASGFAIPRSLHERVVRYSEGSVDVEFHRIAITAADVRTMPLVGHRPNPKDSNLARYQEMCRREGLDRPSATRRRRCRLRYSASDWKTPSMDWSRTWRPGTRRSRLRTPSGRRCGCSRGGRRDVARAAARRHHGSRRAGPGRQRLAPHTLPGPRRPVG